MDPDHRVIKGGDCTRFAELCLTGAHYVVSYTMWLHCGMSARTDVCYIRIRPTSFVTCHVRCPRVRYKSCATRSATLCYPLHVGMFWLLFHNLCLVMLQIMSDDVKCIESDSSVTALFMHMLCVERVFVMTLFIIPHDSDTLCFFPGTSAYLNTQNFLGLEHL